MKSSEKIARVFKALCDPKRVAIIQMLKKSDQCACEIASNLDIAQSKLSYHMKVLCDSGLVECWYVGKWTHYKISKKGSEYAIDLIRQLTGFE